jgi:hypothetical protein
MQLKRCLWLINHETLAKWELPLLKHAGYSYVFTPQVIPRSPSFSSGVVNELEEINFEITHEELKILRDQDWYADVNTTASEVANKYFSHAFTTAEPSQIVTVLKSFSGIVVVRLFGLDLNRTYSDLFKFNFTPHEFRFFTENLNRIVFAVGYKELIIGEEEWLSSRAIFLPIGLPSNPSANWNGNSDKVLAVVPRIEPNSYYEKNYLDHLKMAPGDNILIAGRQHLIHKDKRILGTLKRLDFEKYLESARCMVYASHESRHVHYHPLEAMQIGLPVVYFKDSLLAKLIGTTNKGVVQNKRQSRKIVQKMLKDKRLAQTIGESQRVLVQKLEKDNLEKDFYEGCKKIFEQPTPRQNRNKQVIVFCEFEGQCQTCESLKLKNKDLMRFNSINEYFKYFKLVEVKNDDNFDTWSSATSKVGGNFQYSRTFQGYGKFIEMLWMDHSRYEIHLCDKTLPSVILTECRVSRSLKTKTCIELARGKRSHTLESLRYSLNSLDEIHVSDLICKDLLLAFAPVSGARIDVSKSPS